MKYQLLTFLFFLISFHQVSAQCEDCPPPVIDQVVHIGGGEYDVFWSLPDNECVRAIKLKYFRQGCFVGGSGSSRTYRLSTNPPNPLRITIGTGSHGNENGVTNFKLWSICNQFACPNVCATSDISEQNYVLSTCDCDLFSVDYDCNQICYNIESHNFPCVTFDVKLFNQTTSTLEEFPITSNGESFQLCVDRDPLHSYKTSAKVDADCNPATTLLTAECTTYDIAACDEPCPELPLNDLAFDCLPDGAGFGLAVTGFRACPNYLPLSAAGTTVQVEFCAWQSGALPNCEDDGGACCETLLVPVPESCPQDCPEFPLVRNLQFDCLPDGAGFGLAVTGFRACPNYLPLSAAGTTVPVELCAWQGGANPDCREDGGECCETFQVPVLESCPQDCPEFPLGQDLGFECDPLSGGFTLAVEGFRACPSWLPASAAGTSIPVELCAWQGGALPNCEDDGGMCCETFRVNVPESCCESNADCHDFNYDGSFISGTTTNGDVTLISGITGTISVWLEAYCIPDAVEITINGNAVIMTAGSDPCDGNNSCGNDVSTNCTTFCVNPCDVVRIRGINDWCGDAERCPSNTTAWRLEVRCVEGCGNDAQNRQVDRSEGDPSEDYNPEMVEVSKVEVSPNPVTDVVNINYSTPGVEYQTATIMNSAGQVIHTENIAGQNQIQVDASTFVNGVYLIELTDDYGNRVVEKFMKL